LHAALKVPIMVIFDGVSINITALCIEAGMA